MTSSDTSKSDRLAIESTSGAILADGAGAAAELLLSASARSGCAVERCLEAIRAGVRRLDEEGEAWAWARA